MKIKILLVAVLLAALCGCWPQYTYHKPGGTQQEFIRDDYECERDMRRGNFGEPGLVTALRMEEFYRSCMDAKGYTILKK